MQIDIDEHVSDDKGDDGWVGQDVDDEDDGDLAEYFNEDGVQAEEEEEEVVNDAGSDGGECTGTSLQHATP